MLLISALCRNAISFTNKVRIIYQPLVKTVTYKEYTSRNSFHSSSKNFLKIQNTRKSFREADSTITDINTNVQNNVILYKNQNNNEFLALRVIAYGWFLINGLLAICNYNSEYVSTWSKFATWTEYLRSNGIGILYFTYATTIGPLASLLLFFLNQRIVKYIVLHKGGKQVSIITNHIFKSSKTITMPVRKTKTTVAREKMINYIPLKIQDYKCFFIVDKNGTFSNGKLFDYTVGAEKRW